MEEFAVAEVLLVFFTCNQDVVLGSLPESYGGWFLVGWRRFVPVADTASTEMNPLFKIHTEHEIEIDKAKRESHVWAIVL